MALQFSTALRNAMLDSMETTIGNAAKLQIRTGTQPANCATASSGTLLVEYTLASDWAANASSGSKSFNSTPITGTAVGTGTALHYRILDNAGTTCHEQGNVSAVPDTTGDIVIDNASIATGQTVVVTSFAKTAPGA